MPRLQLIDDDPALLPPKIGSAFGAPDGASGVETIRPDRPDVILGDPFTCSSPERAAPSRKSGEDLPMLMRQPTSLGVVAGLPVGTVSGHASCAASGARP